MAEPLVTLRTGAELRALVRGWCREGLSIGLVPTMGALHDGHMVLVRAALARCDRVIVSIFVNPTQFTPEEDFDAYPRDEERDSERLCGEGVQGLFAPNVQELYPEGSSTQVCVRGLDCVLEGTSRPGHFSGVATVVTKLFTLAQVDHAFFGEKDYQQLLIIRRLVQDLCMGTHIHGVPTLREADGLALSSRNVYLSAEERKIAPALYMILRRVAHDFRAGGDAGRLEIEAREALTKSGFSAIDYLCIVDAHTLEPLMRYDPVRPTRILAAVRLGKTRLLDNIAVNEPPVSGG